MWMKRFARKQNTTWYYLSPLATSIISLGKVLSLRTFSGYELVYSMPTCEQLYRDDALWLYSMMRPFPIWILLENRT